LLSGDALGAAEPAIDTTAVWLAARHTVAAPAMLPKQTTAPMTAITRLTGQIEVELFIFVTTFRVYFVRVLTRWP
jgi:hypothetical protein